MEVSVDDRDVKVQSSLLLYSYWSSTTSSLSLVPSKFEASLGATSTLPSLVELIVKVNDYSYVYLFFQSFLTSILVL